MSQFGNWDFNVSRWTRVGALDPVAAQNAGGDFGGNHGDLTNKNGHFIRQPKKRIEWEKNLEYSWDLYGIGPVWKITIQIIGKSSNR